MPAGKHRHTKSILPFVAGLCLLAQPQDAQADRSQFTGQTRAAGLSFVHAPFNDFSNARMSGGGTVGDFNADGWPDLFVIGGGHTPDRLFLNNQDGTFSDRAAQWGLDAAYRGIGAIAGDYDGDGWEDLYVTSFGNMDAPPQAAQHRLYRNLAGTGFAEVAALAGVNATSPTRVDGFGAAFGDYDLDGDLDLFVSGWFPDAFPGDALHSRLFRNNGDGSFSQANTEAQVLDGNLWGFGAIFADMDGDRYPELLVAGDFGTSWYYANNRDGTFSAVDIWAGQGNGKAHNGMGAALADFDRNGRQDWFLTAIWPTYEYASNHWGNGLYLNDGDHQFRSLPVSSGIINGGWGWGTAAHDFDHDGWVDIVMTNGWPDTDPLTGETFTGEQSYLYRNAGGGEFYRETAVIAGIEHRGEGRGLVTFDYDRDGDMDIVIFTWAGQLSLYRNDLERPNRHWLSIALDTQAHAGLAPRGLGASITVSTAAGDHVASMHGGNSYLGRSELLAHFGLGNAATIDEVCIDWPDGFRTVLQDLPVDQHVQVAATEPLTHGEMLRGQPVEIQLSGIVPGETAHFFFSLSGLGNGPCYAQFGGLCADLLEPQYIGTAVADSAGAALRNATAPVDAGASTVHVQAFVQRGDNGDRSIRSNATTAPLLDARKPPRLLVEASAASTDRRPQP